MLDLFSRTKRNQGSCPWSLVCLSRLLMKTSKSDLWDITMPISHPDIPKVFSEVGSFFFFSNFDRKTVENWSATAMKDEWCNWGLWLWNHVKWLVGLWLSGLSAHLNQEVRFHLKLPKTSGNVAVPNLHPFPPWTVREWEAIPACTGSGEGAVTGTSHLYVTTKTDGWVHFPLEILHKV